MEISLLSKCEQTHPSVYCFLRKSDQQIYSIPQEVICKSANIDIALTNPSLSKKFGKQWRKLYGYTFIPVIILAIVVWVASESLFQTFYLTGIFLLFILFPFLFYYFRTQRKLQKICQFETRIFGQAFVNEVPYIDAKYLFR